MLKICLWPSCMGQMLKLPGVVSQCTILAIPELAYAENCVACNSTTVDWPKQHCIDAVIVTSDWQSSLLSLLLLLVTTRLKKKFLWLFYMTDQSLKTSILAFRFFSMKFCISSRLLFMKRWITSKRHQAKRQLYHIEQISL